LALLALLVPVWIPWVLLPLLERQGVNVSGFDRQGYSLLELRGLTYTNESVTVKAGTLAVQSPHRWFLDRLGWFDRENEAQLRVSEWRVQVHPRTSTNQPPGTNSLSAALDQAGLIIERFRPWIHQVDAREGEFI
ncbi:MAG TPA: hypothetical protein DCY13_14715, partial [Verrucomicrobiales bacterium]|nr:hypothetical protein [Verrucomicrobiales bacterium]